MHRTDTRTCEHGHKCLGDHWHIDDDTVAGYDALIAQRTRERRGLCLQFSKRRRALFAGDRAVIDYSGLVSAPIFNVAVNGIVTGVDLRVGEPFV